MAIQNVTLQMTGLSPLVMHSGRLVDPGYWASKELKRLHSKRGKTEADIAEAARVEFLGSLCLDEQKRVILPDTVIEASLVNGAKKLRLGQQTKAGLFASDHAVLNYGAEKSPEDLWADEAFRLYVPARVGTNRVMRMRPIFRKWSAVAKISFLDDLLNKAEVLQIAETAGLQACVGDWRPKYGRYSVQDVS